MYIVSKWVRARHTQYLQYVHLLSHCLRFLIACTIQGSGSIWWLLQCLRVWGGGSKWELHDLFAVCSAVQHESGDARRSSSAKTFSTYHSHNRSNYTTVTSSVIQRANTWQSLTNQHRIRRVGNFRTPVANQDWEAGGNTKVEDEVQVPTFEGDEDAGRGHWVIAHRVPESEAGQCQEGVDCPQTVQLHGRPTSSSTQRVCFKKISAGTKTETWEEKILNSTPQKKSATISLLSFINLCDLSNQRLPRAPSLRVLAMQHWGVEITPRSLGTLSPDGEEPSFWGCVHTSIW